MITICEVQGVRATFDGAQWACGDRVLKRVLTNMTAAVYDEHGYLPYPVVDIPDLVIPQIPGAKIVQRPDIPDEPEDRVF